MTTEIATLLDGDLTLGRLRVIAGRLGLPQDTFSHMSPEDEQLALIDYLDGILEALERHRMTLTQYVAIVDARTSHLERLPVTPFGQRRGRLV